MQLEDAVPVITTFTETAALDTPVREALQCVLEHVQQSVRVPLSDEYRECIEADAPNSISYWGSIKYRTNGAIVYCHGSRFEYLLPEHWIDVGLRRLAAEKHQAFFDIMSESYDAFSLDALVQMATFGEVRFS